MKNFKIAFFASLIACSWTCMRSAVRVQSGENPFISGNVVFEGSVNLYVLEPKRVGAVEWVNGGFSDTVSAWRSGDFKLRFIAADGHYIDCPVNDGRFDCVLPQGRYKYFLLQGLNLAGMSGMVTSGVKLQEFLQWFRIPEQATATGTTNHLGAIIVEHYPDFQLTGMRVPVPNVTADVLKSRPDVISFSTTYVDKQTKAAVDFAQILKFRESGTSTRIELPTESQKREILAKYPTGTTMFTVELQPHSRACLSLSMIKSKKPFCGYGFMNDNFAEKSNGERFDE